MDRLRPLLLALAGLAGVGVAVWFFADSSPVAPEPVAPVVQASTPAQARPFVARDDPPDQPEPMVRAPADGRAEGLPTATRGTTGPGDALDERIAEWQETAPVALHAERDAERWLDVADSLQQHGYQDLSIRARTISLRLDRARQPVVATEARAALIEEVDILREATRLARDEIGDDDLYDLLRDIEQGAHAALQGAPPPEQWPE